MERHPRIFLREFVDKRRESGALSMESLSGARMKFDRMTLGRPTDFSGSKPNRCQPPFVDKIKSKVEI